ncbi:hypothetical protein PVL29_014597 [Vitis rotundifolia]|uniref:Uncharacterized protein n=1 Tax=Vitis rotundifolia TaxID=103349 RepID=A0AA38ZH89_VITRO|nr:hypothetical protein PVL29_014597 [Vitis rotundifolia]
MLTNHSSRPHLICLLGSMSNPSTTVCIRWLTAVLLRECVLYNKSIGNGKKPVTTQIPGNPKFDPLCENVMSNGTCTAVLMGQSYLVKGVAWDPIGSFIASQTDDKTVIIKTMVHLFHS